MAELPFLVVHGAVVWKVLLAALVGGSVGLVALVRVCWVRLRARAKVSARAGKLAAIAEGDACVRGYLRGGSLATLAGGDATRDHVEGAPHVECEDGTRIELAGRPRVAVGARTATSRLRVPAGTPEAIVDRGGRWVLRAVGDGDAVVATGKVTRIAHGDAGYRDDGTAWRLTDGEVAAIAPKAKPRPVHPVALVAGLAVAVATWYGVLHEIGASALERVDRRPDRATEREVAPFGAFAIAAAMPGSRDEAFLDASESFGWRYHHLGSVVALRDTIDAAIGPCRSVEPQLREIRLDAALASARSCGDATFEAYVQLFLGNYEQALASPEPWVRERAAIGLGDWKVAAEAAGAQAAEYAEAAAARARCRAAWYRNLAGVSTTVPTEGDSQCAIYAALLQPADRRRELLRAIAETEHNKPHGERSYLPLVRALLGEPADEHMSLYGRVGGIEWMSSHQPDAASSRHHVDVARVAVLRGDFARVRGEAAAIEGNMPRSALALWIALREGTELPRVDDRDLMLQPAAMLRTGKFPPDLVIRGVLPEACGDDLRVALGKAFAGDGGPLAQVYAECNVFYHSSLPELLFGILPRVTQHRAELADALRVFRDQIVTYSADRVPFRLVEHLAESRDLARLAGDTEEADRLQAIIRRHAQALADRDRTTAFALLE